ncbi:hypothetical protein ACHHYP_15810 [Achlya hypogyna]|uniref:SBF1/SBF2 domain-containing protein n=1 Tax=Achlya hypogyna TaxID=1202772 RepID=A0A1V9ZET5_ACHHY|nr:hypothetical protein ACHHYP_15810 [Achlya hypogyna]
MDALLADEENQSRRTFCQMAFGDIYDNAEKGQSSLGSLLRFFERQTAAERQCAEDMLGFFQDKSKPGSTSDLASFEEPGTSLARVLAQVQQYTLALHTQQLVWAKVIDEHVTRPLQSLQAASSSYIQTLEMEIVRVNEEYGLVQAAQLKVNESCATAERNLKDAKARQRHALHEIGVPSFELQRLAARVAKCKSELAEAAREKATTKQLLLAKIVARDEMAMAVSVAYQRAEEERMDQIAAGLKMWASVERDQIRVRETQLCAIDDLVARLDRAADLQLLIHNHKSSDHMHFQGKALAILEWHWQHEQHPAIVPTDDSLDTDEEALDAAASPPSEGPSADVRSIQAGLAGLFETHLFSDAVEPPPATEVTPVLLAAVARWCSTHEGRLAFVQTLNRQRSHDTRLQSAEGFGQLVRCFDIFFDACAAGDDVKAAKTAMMLAATFYHVPEAAGPQRVARKYVQDEIKHHAIWRNPKFWEKALLLAIGEELHKAPQEIPWEELPTNVPRSHGVFTREEAVCLVHNVVFGQLGSFTLSMLELDVPLDDIRHFVETMCDAHELTEDQRFVLRANLRDIALTRAEV